MSRIFLSVIKTSSGKTEGKKKSRAFLEFRPYSAFTFGGRNRKPKAENFRFRPKVSASGIPLENSNLLFDLDPF